MLSFLNYYVLQWFFFRLARKTTEDDKTISWGFIFPVKPGTGWIGGTSYFKPSKVPYYAVWTLLLLVMLCMPATAANIGPENRVANDEKRGLCWWACADMIGRELNIKPLIGLKEAIIKEDKWKSGATLEAITAWVAKLQVKPQSIHTKDHLFLFKYMDKNLPVIAHMKWWEGTPRHAILLLNITRQKQKWKDGNGREFEDYIITFIDPNSSERKHEHTWNHFWKYWAGEAYAFDPADQDPALVAPILGNNTKFRPGRLMVATGKFEEEVVKDTIVQSPPIYPHQLPYPNQLFVYDKKVLERTNQDLKDGIARPNDKFKHLIIGGSYDYHSEYRAKAGAIGGHGSPR